MVNGIFRCFFSPPFSNLKMEEKHESYQLLQDEEDNTTSNMSCGCDSDKEEGLFPPMRKFRDKVGAAVNNDKVQNVLLFFIVVNSALIIIGLFDFVKKNQQLDQAFTITDKVFLIIFTIEIMMQMIYHGFALFYDGWCYQSIL